MPLIRWEPAREFSTIQSEMNRLLNTFFDTPTTSAPAAGGQRRWTPAMDLIEQDSEYVLQADLPGLTEQDVQIELDESILTISGERKPALQDQAPGRLRIERGFGSFRRSVRLPDGVDADRIAARFTNGVLEVRVPKPEQPKPRKVQISVGNAAQDSVIEAGESAQNSIEASPAE